MNKIKRMLHRIEKRVRFKWYCAPIATERILVGEIVGLHRGFWGQLYARPAEGAQSDMFAGVAAEIITPDQPYPTWAMITHGGISGLVSDLSSVEITSKEIE